MKPAVKSLEETGTGPSNAWKPYPAYKDSGAPWLGRVPKGWEMRRLKYLLREVDDRSQDGEERLLSVSQYTGVTPRRKIEGSDEHDTRATSLVGYKKVAVNDLAINIMLAWNGSLGVSAFDGVVSPAYCVYRFAKGLSPWFFHNLLRTPQYKARIKQASRGVVESRLRLYSEDLGRIEAVLPPPADQDAIVQFLDRQDRLIRTYIRAKQKLIALLTEQKQAIIQRAVTRGLNPAAQMKPSGVPWLGEIPQHWELKPNRTFLKIRKVLVGSRHPEYQLLSLTKRGVIVRDLSEMKGKFSADMGTSQEVRPGDLVFCLFDVPETPRTIGLSHHHGMITSAYTVMECADQGIARFLEAFYIAMDDRKTLSPLYSGLRNTIPKGRLLGAKTPVPPPEERDAILRYIAKETEPLESTANFFARQITLMREYRTRLITDVVTGKVDVRAAAAALPAELSDTVQEDTSGSGEREEQEALDAN